MNKTIFCDLDGTLILNDGKPNLTLIRWLEKQDAQKVVWSARGSGAVFEAMQKHDELFNLKALKLSKPNVLIDNNGLAWLRFVRVITRNGEFE